MPDDAVAANRALDAQLAESGCVDRELFLRLSEAHGYGAATSIGWLESKLRILQRRLRSGAPVSVYDLGTNDTFNPADEQAFADWARANFPDASLDS